MFDLCIIIIHLLSKVLSVMSTMIFRSTYYIKPYMLIEHIFLHKSKNKAIYNVAEELNE